MVLTILSLGYGSLIKSRDILNLFERICLFMSYL